MPKSSKKMASDDANVNPVLSVTRSKAEEMIGSRIPIGEELFSREIHAEAALEKAWDDYHGWDKFNGELLARLFDSDKYAREYAHTGPRVFSMYPSVYEQIANFKDTVRHSLRNLKSLLERLPLIDEVAQLSSISGQAANVPTIEIVEPSNRIFVVHGHDDSAKMAVTQFLRKIGLEPIVLHEKANEGNTIIEKFERHSEDVAFAVVLLTPDDVGAAKKDSDRLRERARQNVVLELGYFIGRLGRKKVCALLRNEVEQPSDMNGVLYIPFDSGGAWQMHLGKELRAAGINASYAKMVE